MKPFETPIMKLGYSDDGEARYMTANYFVCQDGLAEFFAIGGAQEIVLRFSESASKNALKCQYTTALCGCCDKLIAHRKGSECPLDLHFGLDNFIRLRVPSRQPFYVSVEAVLP